MKPKDFSEQILKNDKISYPGIQTLRRILDRFDSYENKMVSQKARHDWVNHRDYYKYDPSKHTIMCCGWTDWHDHKDS